MGLTSDFLLLLLFSHQVVSDSLQPHGLQHARLPCPSLSPRVCTNSCPLSQFFLVPLNFRVTYYISIITGRTVPPYLLITLSNKLILFHVLHEYLHILNLYSIFSLTKWFLKMGDKLLYNVVLVSAIQQHGSAINIHISPPSWASLPPPTPSVHSRLSQSARLGSLYYIATSTSYLFYTCTQYASKFGKLSSSHRTGKGQFSFQSQRKAMPKNAQTTAQLHSSHTLVK